MTESQLGKAQRFARVWSRTRRTKGTGPALRLVAAMVVEVSGRPFTRYQDRLLDRRLGADTGRVTPRPVLNPAVAAEARHDDAVAYSPTPARLFRRILRSLPVDSPRQFTFVDLGCGKGRTLLMAAEHGFGRVIGVDFDPDLVGVARLNAAAHALTSRSYARVEVVHADAASFDLPPEPTVLFLFNPFGADTLRAVFDRIERSLAARPRPFVVAYVNPMHADVLDGGTLRPTTRTARWAVYAAATG